MPPADSAAFFPSLGWLTALMFAALLPSLTGGIGRRQAGWLIAFGAVRLLLTAAAFVQPLLGAQAHRIGALLAATLLWEFARRLWNETARRRISAATHLAAVETLALIVAATLPAGAGGQTAGEFLPLETLFAVLPTLFAGASALVLWRVADGGPHREAWRLAAIGFALHSTEAATLPALRAAGQAAPWLIAAGTGAICLRTPAIRTRALGAWIAGLLLVASAGPLVVAMSLRQIDARKDDHMTSRALQLAGALQGHFALLLENDALTPEARRTVFAQLAALRAADPLLHSATIWKLHGEFISELDLTETTARFRPGRVATSGEKEHAKDIRPFFSATQPSLATVHAPLRRATYETPSAWVALDYPDAFWAVQREHARRTGAALIGAFAAFCAMGFVLAGRQAIETSQAIALERAESADRAKSEFLAFLSHEMRTPLQTILGRAELLRREAPAATRHADAIADQGTHLLRLVNDLLDLGTIEAGKLKLQPAPFALRPLLAALEEIHGPAAAAKGLTLHVSVASEVPDTLLGDEARLRQILGNLLGNAVKYTARGTVALAVTTSGNESGSQLLNFTITDSGPGLPPEKIPQLFTLFTRLDAGDTFTREGTGVGLALVRRLCDLMGGTVAAANRPERGAVFTVQLRFPVAAAAVAPLPATFAARSTTPTSALRVLVAEDNAAVRAFLAEAITALGHHVATVGEGEAVLAACAAATFDVVVLDINLPGRDGIALARILSSRTPRPRLIACSAEAGGVTRDAALGAGIDLFLEKPATIAALAAALTPIAPLPTGASLFDRLRSPEHSADARVALGHDLPAAIATFRAAHREGDAAALQRHAHHLRSTALLAGDETLAELCGQLERSAAAGTAAEQGAIIAAFAPRAAVVSA